MSERLTKVHSEIDAANGADPNLIEVDGEARPAEQVYGERMSGWLDRFAPDANELVRIAVRAQHLERFRLPRSAYPMDKPGYHRWRNEQKRRHAERIAGIMTANGYTSEEAERVASIVRKENLKRDPDVQLLEDVACLVFMQFYFASFARDHEADKIVGIVARTWVKMSEKAHEAALALPLPEDLAPLVHRGIAQATGTVVHEAQ
ncbi:DUF4202 domain-containing protein [Stappia sp. F7233]|uniref:DUF4202 domain-containing protein n=1 Tax=Stappia albiluteola TaxID=2758565 RepID=A0A839AI72_9HYPH|nr:DUF4202 domain-containing protein [Stappia albiluteola]MBA5778766.1 DUF4202 domain-containing protein [Stappia albiluteola]